MVEPSHFDPFNKRQARDIRNNLSKSFLQSLAKKDAAIFQRCGDTFLKQDIESDYETYVTTRLKKYAEAYVIIKQRRLKEALPQAEILWGLGLYFEMHELLEPVWKEEKGERRRALQGLIRAAGMKIHAENRNMKAAFSMGAKAQADLLQYGGELTDYVTLGAILAEIEQTLSYPHNHSQGISQSG